MPVASEVTIGRIARYVFRDGTERPAMVVWVADNCMSINLQVFLDGPADTGLLTADERGEYGVVYRNNVAYGRPDPEGNAKPYTWHWPGG